MAPTSSLSSSDTQDFDAETTLNALRSQAEAVVERIRPQIDALSGYARAQPARALLISAATGAALMGLMGLLVRSGSRSVRVPEPPRSAMANIRDAAIDLADRAHNAATKALDASQMRAVAAAASAADSASETLADTWQSLRDQASPVIDKIRPQVDAATSYAKEEPARAALGVVAAGALLMGLMALVSGSDKD